MVLIFRYRLRVPHALENSITITKTPMKVRAVTFQRQHATWCDHRLPRRAMCRNVHAVPFRRAAGSEREGNSCGRTVHCCENTLARTHGNPSSILFSCVPRTGGKSFTLRCARNSHAPAALMKSNFRWSCRCGGCQFMRIFRQLLDTMIDNRMYVCVCVSRE